MPQKEWKFFAGWKNNLESKKEKHVNRNMKLDTEEILFSLMSLYYDELFRYGIRFTSDAAETKNGINQFFLHFWENRDKLQNVENVKAYIFVSYKRWLIARLRQRQQNRTMTLPDDDRLQLCEQSYEDYLVEQIRDHEQAQVFREAIKALPARQKQLVQLRFYEHLSYEEISQRTSLSVRTVYNKLHEAIKKLRTHKQVSQIRNR